MAKLSTLVIGAGDRGNKVMHRARDMLEVTAVAEPDEEKMQVYADKHKIFGESRYATGEQALGSGQHFDMVYIATPDKTHTRLAISALSKGYNVLLEKPMALKPSQCIKIIKAQEKSGKSLAICHVLRYAPFFQNIKKIAKSGELGKIISIDLVEEVGYWHFAHSYVRGNWGKEEDASPVILAKSCHDLDIISWLADSTPKSIFSKSKLFSDSKEKILSNFSKEILPSFQTMLTFKVRLKIGRKEMTNSIIIKSADSLNA